jgi:peptidyl-prolyl cis-trans isomerase C
MRLILINKVICYNAQFYLTIFMKNIILLLLILFLSACNEQKAQQLPESEVIAVVGDQSVTVDLLDAFLVANGIAKADDKVVGQALEKLIEEVAIANIANKKKLVLTKEQLNTFKYLQIRAMANNAKKDYLANNEITDEDIKKEYDQANKQAGGIQFHVHHVLYKDEVQAIKLLENIKTAEQYKVFETDYLQQNPKMKGIGDLGWVTLGQLPKSFRDQLPLMQENTVLNKVLSSKYGAHIVYLQGVRKLEAPKLEDVKEGIVRSIKTKKLSKFSQLAKAKAHVIIKE